MCSLLKDLICFFSTILRPTKRDSRHAVTYNQINHYIKFIRSLLKDSPNSVIKWEIPEKAIHLNATPGVMKVVSISLKRSFNIFYKIVIQFSPLIVIIRNGVGRTFPYNLLSILGPAKFTSIINLRYLIH